MHLDKLFIGISFVVSLGVVFYFFKSSLLARLDSYIVGVQSKIHNSEVLKASSEKALNDIQLRLSQIEKDVVKMVDQTKQKHLEELRLKLEDVSRGLDEKFDQLTKYLDATHKNAIVSVKNEIVNCAMDVAFEVLQYGEIHLDGPKEFGKIKKIPRQNKTTH